MSRSASAPFTKVGVLMVLIVGFVAFLAILYSLAMGDSGLENGDNGRAHAASRGLNGYSSLVELVDADDFEVTRSRETGGLETADLLVLTPPLNANPEELARLINSRRDLGPTLIILPKWDALPASLASDLETPEEAKDGWVFLYGMERPNWTSNEFAPLSFVLEERGRKSSTGPDAAPVSEPDEATQSFATLGSIAGITGELPSNRGWHATKGASHKPLVVDQAGRSIALSYIEPGAQGEDADPSWVVFVIEPDLMNNWGLADDDRALAALSIVRSMADDYSGRVVFDLTLNGFGGAMNLLTLAFQPPFLAATMCLILALFVLGWRAFLRFGPPATTERETAFGKASLVTNGADLIARAGRLNLLAEPYIKLTQERSTGGDAGSDPSSTMRANDMRRATKPGEILRAARALYRQSQDT